MVLSKIHRIRYNQEFLDAIMGPEQLRAYGQQPHCHQRFLRVVWDLRFPLQPQVQGVVAG